MKKLVLFFATAIVAVSFAACGNKSAESENQDTTAVETVVEEVVTPTVDTVAAVVDSTAAAVK